MNMPSVPKSDWSDRLLYVSRILLLFLAVTISITLHFVEPRSVHLARTGLGLLYLVLCLFVFVSQIFICSIYTIADWLDKLFITLLVITLSNVVILIS
jgi:hypothetical protein